ncbi:phage protein [Streptococcus pneumoniae SPN994038]|nr:phage protein [Streptococcus pneumoniae OXC141]CCP29781.1 phage protein [Streptococcus pneumoniae SPN994038]CCP31755.1 phage protein [Streptococcus pneumoniae SPN034183]CCP33740.1 phage protein [Streptococcus pneumoniae SPN994039]CCP36776.1 phage protein [Streptococcus pneumoniae SPN034156]
MKNLMAETVKWEKQVIDVSQNIVRNKHFDSLFQNTFR